MAVMGTNTRELDINTLVLTAYQYAGVMNELQTAQGPQWDARGSYGRTQLEIVIDALAADGIFERSMATYDLAVTAGEAGTELPADTVDVRGDAMLLVDTETELPLRPLTRGDYAAITLKSEGGPPSGYYVARSFPMYLYLWPVPEVDCTIRIQRQRLSFDNSSGAATVDLERFWMDYLLHELASRIALGSGIPIDRVTMLQAKASAAKLAARGKSSGQLSNQMVVNHPGPHRRY